jgi:hypothetical protein
VERDGLIEMALSMGIGVVNTRFPRPAIIESNNGEPGVLFMPGEVQTADARLIHDWLTGLRNKMQEVA